MTILEARALSLGFGQQTIIDNISLHIEKGDMVSILGPNGSGKSTLLKGLSRNLRPMNGSVYLNSKDIYRMSASDTAKQLAALPQLHESPGDVTVRDLVGYGRFPHQKWWKESNREDDKIIAWAMNQTGVEGFADRPVATLSGGERQRVWLAMAIAQKPQVLLLDEPTTYLDICHQLEIMELVRELNQRQEITVVMVLHDINHAAKYSNRIIVLNKGKIFAAGSPNQVINRDMIAGVFGVKAEIMADAEGNPVFIARGLSRPL